MYVYSCISNTFISYTLKHKSGLFLIHIEFKKMFMELLSWSSGWDSALPPPRALVQSLVGELRSCNSENWPHRMDKKKKTYPLPPDIHMITVKIGICDQHNGDRR